ncbi:MAG: hypothetical protein SVP52_00205 [Chloroflexota bacterium]|nr:hypothetical protein [Chloroflexota bacterium]
MMTLKKKFFITAICLLLNLTFLACHIPLISRAIGPEIKSVDMTPSENVDTRQIGPTEIVEQQTPTVSENEVFAEEQVYRDKGVEITLPATFVLGDVEDDFEALMEEGQLVQGDQAESIKAIFENYKEDILLWGYDLQAGDQYGTSLLVMKNEQFAGMPLMIVSTFAKSIIGEQLDFVDQQQIKMENRDVLRFETSTGELGVENSQAFYLFNESGKLWIIAFFTDFDQIQDSLQDFDKAVESFRFVGDA